MSPLVASRTNTSGLSVALFNSTAAVSRACASASRTAPCTCGVQRRLYASCTRGSFSDARCDSRIWLPSFRCARFRAVVAAPAYARACMIRASNAPGLPRSASSEREAATSAVSTRMSASRNARLSSASIPWVPFSSESPSFASSVTGAIPARFMASPPGRISPRNAARPSPITTCARCASGARSPEAPTEPCDGITGCTLAFSIWQRVSTTRGRTPLSPFASAFARSSIIARVSASLSGEPTPLACERTKFTCSCRTCSAEIRTEASFPNPVLMPYAVAPEATTRSTTARDAFIRSIAPRASETFWPRRAAS